MQAPGPVLGEQKALLPRALHYPEHFSQGGEAAFPLNRTFRKFFFHLGTYSISAQICLGAEAQPSFVGALSWEFSSIWEGRKRHFLCSCSPWISWQPHCPYSSSRTFRTWHPQHCEFLITQRNLKLCSQSAACPLAERSWVSALLSHIYCRSLLVIS